MRSGACVLVYRGVRVSARMCVCVCLHACVCLFAFLSTRFTMLARACQSGTPLTAASVEPQRLRLRVCRARSQKQQCSEPLALTCNASGCGCAALGPTSNNAVSP